MNIGQWIHPIQEVITAVVLEVGDQLVRRERFRSWAEEKRIVREALRKYFDADRSPLHFEECCEWLVGQILDDINKTPFD